MKPIASTFALALVVFIALNNPFGHGSVAVASPQDATFTVVNSGFSAYLVDGVSNGSLMLTRGQTYTFNVTSVGHPFFIKTIRTTGSTNQFASGVTGQGVTSGTLKFVVPVTAPNQLFYQCGVHAAMGGNLAIADPLAVPGPQDPNRAWLRPAAPNPTRVGAQFQFGLPRSSAVDLTIFDARGSQVRNLDRTLEAAGEHTVRWDGHDDAGRRVVSGMYFYRLRTDGRQLGGRLVVTK